MIKELNNHILSLENISETAKQIINLDTTCRIFLFDAPMGAGKTTLIKEICKYLGSTDNFSSPTFSIVNEYAYSKGKIFHLDLYRLKIKEEVLDIGIEEYLDSKNYCFIEWSTLAEDMIASEYIKVSISVNNNIRYISATKIVPGLLQFPLPKL